MSVGEPGWCAKGAGKGCAGVAGSPGPSWGHNVSRPARRNGGGTADPSAGRAGRPGVAAGRRPPGAMNAGSRGASRASTGPPPAHGGSFPRAGGTAPRTLRSGPAVRRPTTPAGRGDDPALPGGRPGGRPHQPAQGVFRLADRALAPRTGTAPPPPLRRAEPRHRPGRGARESRRRLGRPPGAGAGRPAVRGGTPAGNRSQPVRQQDGVASPGARPPRPELLRQTSFPEWPARHFGTASATMLAGLRVWAEAWRHIAGAQGHVISNASPPRLPLRRSPVAGPRRLPPSPPAHPAARSMWI